MSTSLKYPIAASIFFVLVGTALINAAPQGFLEGQLKIISRRSVALADENTAPMTARNYADYPLIILTRDETKQIARIIAERTETIVKRCHQAITFWMCKGVSPRSSAQNRSHSRSSPMRRSMLI